MSLSKDIKKIEVGQRLEGAEILGSDGFWFDLNEGHISMYINYFAQHMRT